MIRSTRLGSAVLATLFVIGLSTLASEDERIAQLVDGVTPDILEKRHQIHRNPELGNREFETAKLVADHLRSLGIEVTEKVGHTGVVGLLKGGKSGPVVAVRADMDALPVTEDTDLPFKSEKRTKYLGKEVGVMHACGHDIHVAVQLGVASVLAAMRDELPGTVKFIFQPAEEGPPPGEEGGADLMIREGILDNPRPGAIFGLHALAGMDVGKVGFTSGPTMAAVDHFTIYIEGKQVHGAYPHLGVDPVVMASQAVMAFQTIRSRTLPALAPSVVTVGIINGGERFNIIPARVKLEGTVRTYEPEIRDTVEARMRTILEGIAKAYGGSFEMEYDRGAPATINDPALAKRMLPTLHRLLGEQNVLTLDPVMGGEDFAWYAKEIPGFYFRLGQVRKGTTSGGHHTPTFRADDSCIPVGIKAMTHLVMDWLNGENK